jgi:replication factor C small subunit
LIDLESPWVEKYRPQNFSDIVSQNIAIENIKDFINSSNMPHMIFTGPAGTGKTSTALIIAREAIKNDNFNVNVLELNASDTVRMDYVRTVIKDFVNQNVIVGSATVKFILLDEADNIPTQVQQALRRIIEKASNDVKFILLCNYINKIIDPIISRCAVFRFVKLSKEKIIERLKLIIKKEKIIISPEKAHDFYETLFFISEGDLRKAINTLQMAVALELINNLDLEEILKISGFLDKNSLNKLILAVKGQNLKEAKDLIESIENFDSRNLLRQIIEILPSLKINPTNYTNVISFIGEIDYKISQGSDEQIQITALIAELIRNIES